MGISGRDVGSKGNWELPLLNIPHVFPWEIGRIRRKFGIKQPQTQLFLLSLEQYPGALCCRGKGKMGISSGCGSRGAAGPSSCPNDPSDPLTGIPFCPSLHPGSFGGSRKLPWPGSIQLSQGNSSPILVFPSDSCCVSAALGAGLAFPNPHGC